MAGAMTGKAGLITGGNSGIGRATALKFAREGASVAIVGRNPETADAVVREIVSAGGKGVFIQADVGDPGQVEAMVRQTVDAFGGLDFAVNNAASPSNESGPMQSLVDITVEQWDRAQAVNLRGTWLGMKYQIPEMLKRGGGAIVNVSSTAGGRAFAGMGGYVASKFAINGLTKVAALEFAQQGIRVNAVLPGPVDSPIVQSAEDLTPGHKKMLASLVPMGRMGEAEEIAEAICWLCSDAASFVTGTNFPVDGGALEK